MSNICELTGKRYQSGNNVSHSQRKTRRRFNPNIQPVTFHSDALGQALPMKVAASTLRSVEHNGGIDQYLLTTANGKLTDNAVTLKHKIRKASAAAS